jgi:hypothetical protein
MSAPVLAFSQTGKATAPPVKRAAEKLAELYALNRDVFDIADKLLDDLIRDQKEAMKDAWIYDDDEDEVTAAPTVVPAKVRSYIWLERRCSGPRRTFWAQRSMSSGNLSHPPVSEWTPAVVSAIRDDIASRFFPQESPNDESSAVDLACHVQPGRRGQGDHLCLCIMRGRWRVLLLAGWEKDLPAAVGRYLRGLPRTEDSSRPADTMETA